MPDTHHSMHHPSNAGDQNADNPSPGPAVRAALGLLWLYKRTVSPVFAFFGARCRHMPGCADYAAEAFRRHGAHQGAWLTASRLCRCHPWGSHGWDPAPDHPRPNVGWRIWRHGDWAWTARPAYPNAEQPASNDTEAKGVNAPDPNDPA